MKKIIQVGLFTFLTMAFAQDKGQLHENVTENFILNYNSSNYSDLYHMLDPVMQQLASEAHYTNLIKTVRSNFGTIKQMEVSGKSGTAYRYKTTFEKGLINIFMGVDEHGKISSLFIPRNEEEYTSIPERNTTAMIFPFKEEAFVYWGGETLEQNYHMEDPNQQFAYDILMVAGGAPFKGDPTINESYLVFGKELMAPCDAIVVKVIDGIADNTPGEVNTESPTGNTLILQTASYEYVLMGHLKMHSIQVREGEQVKKGQVIAQCGNSGNTTQAHLHLQLQNTPDLFNALGVKLYFEEIMVNGQLRKDHMPVKEDLVKNTGPY
ncbi:peptidoglycan DD-metalloendopeptidase family protein [Robertkochia sediminum]|uniref:peptidoglycan DD-metalloendopeptidase family protein n=1 Tax=Robertkochia sediminum TaxID=2785326 RepID=UPI0019334A8E|nr:peptidoglycan DD-metalloendopeptidase family protein [Robertkochia sediminum]MBL7472945.1 peptidoglycan DD-metalloendopeptidase family protein [Robertkochia sediminum]